MRTFPSIRVFGRLFGNVGYGARQPRSLIYLTTNSAYGSVSQITTLIPARQEGKRCINRDSVLETDMFYLHDLASSTWATLRGWRQTTDPSNTLTSLYGEYVALDQKLQLHRTNVHLNSA